MQMRPTPERQYNVCPTGWACQPVRAPGVNETTVARMRDGSCPTSTSSWNTSPVKLAAAPRRVARAAARTTVMALLLALENSPYDRPVRPSKATLVARLQAPELAAGIGPPRKTAL